MVTLTEVTLSSVFYTFDGVNGYVHPGDDPTDWWTLGDDTNGYIELDPGVTIKVRSEETRSAITLLAHTVQTHKNLAEVGCQVQATRDSDTTYFYFTITNNGSQGVRLDFDDPIAYIVV